MTNRIWIFLPNFLKAMTGTLYHIIQSIGHVLDQVLDEGKLLQPRSMANRLGGFTEYYASDDRKDDLALIGLSRFLFKRGSETWGDFETRLTQFPNDVFYFGTAAGVKKEIERTGLACDLIEELTDDKYRWVLLALTDQCLQPEDQISHIFNLGEEDPYVRGTRVYVLDDSELFSFAVYLSGETEYSENEITEIIKFTKPAYTKCYCFFPDQEYAEAII